MKLIPQYSIRWLLAATAVVAMVFSIVAAGYNGHLWATGVSVGILALVVLLAVCGALFAMVWVVSTVLRPSRAGAQSPFKPPTLAAEEPVAAVVVAEPTHPAQT